MQATSQDPDTARLMGINVDRIIMVAFALGAALAAVAGLAYGLRYTNIDFRMGFLAGLKAFTAAVLGGIGNIAGAVVGGLVLGVVEVLATVHPRALRRLGLEGRLGLRAADPGPGVPTARPARARGWWTGHERVHCSAPEAAATAAPGRAHRRHRRWRAADRFGVPALGVRVQCAGRHDAARQPVTAAVRCGCRARAAGRSASPWLRARPEPSQAAPSRLGPRAPRPRAPVRWSTCC